MDKIIFKKDGYDPLIDYIKGLCIIFVVLTHTMSRNELNHILFPYWGDTAVPIFLIIQAFHYYKKGTDVRMPRVLKLMKRILLPFIITIILMFLVQIFIYYDVTDGNFSPKLYWDKRGPGSYYIFIYLEFSLVIPLLAPLFKRLSLKWCLVVFIILSQLIEFICSITHCPDHFYRILFVRYLFLIYIGYLIATNGIEINKLTIGSGIIGIIFMYIFNYIDLDMEPLFYTSLSNWKYCHWLCYIYIAYIFLWFLKSTFTWLKANKRILHLIESVGKSSYEIYLFQIFYFSTIGIYIYNSTSFISNDLCRLILFIFLSTAICICPILLVKKKR